MSSVRVRGCGGQGNLGAAGYCLMELMAALSIAATVTAIAVPQLLAAIDNFRTLGAVRYVATRLQLARMEAIARNANVAIRFVQSGSSYDYTVYQDGNGNGVMSRDIQRNIDQEVHPAERLSSQFSGVDFGVLPGLPPIDPTGAAPGADPIKLGASNMVSFSSMGTSTAGSLYVLGRRSSQYAIVIYGETGKTRILKYDQRIGQWRPL